MKISDQGILALMNKKPSENYISELSDQEYFEKRKKLILEGKI